MGHLNRYVWVSLLIVPLLLAATGDNLKPKSAKARAAITKYDRAVAKAKADYDSAVAAAKKNLKGELDVALRAALKAESLDEAKAIEATMLRHGEGDPEPTGSVALMKQLPRTRWDGGGGTELVFESGTFYFSDWGSKRGTWKVVSPQTIRLKFPDGHEMEYTFDRALKNHFRVAEDGRHVGVFARVS